MTDSIKTIDGLLKTENSIRTVFLNDFVCSVSVNQFNGEIAAALPLSAEVKIYPQNPNSNLEETIIIDNIEGQDLVFPNIVQFDPLNGYLWINDIGLNKLFKINAKNLNVLSVFNNIYNVVSIASLGNRGFVKMFEGTNTIQVKEIISNTETKIILEYNTNYSFSEPTSSKFYFNSLPSPSSLKIDIVDNVLWDFLNDNIYKVNIQQNNITKFIASGIAIKSLDTQYSSNYLFVCGKEIVGNKNYILKIDKDTGESIWNKKIKLYEDDVLNDFEKDIHKIILDQKKQDIIPFSFSVKNNPNMNTDEIGFSIHSAPKPSSYNDLLEIGKDNIKNIKSDTYVWEKEDSKFTHNNEIYVDLLFNNESGLKEYSLRTQKDRYVWEKDPGFFYTPKFTWIKNNNAQEEEEENSNLNGLNKFWFGNNTSEIGLIEYRLGSDESTNNKVETLISEQLDSSVTSIKRFHNELYVSTTDYLYKYTFEMYKNEIEFHEVVAKDNTNSDMFELVQKEYVWSIQPFYGRVIKRDRETLEVEEIYSGFDSPLQLEYRSNFNEIIVRCSNYLWKINIKTNVVNAFAGSDSWKMTQMACSPNNIAYIMEKNEVYKLRVLGTDCYEMLLDYKSENILNFSTYLKNNDFYFLEEVEDNDYVAIHHVFNSKSKSIRSIKTKSEYLEPFVEEPTVDPVNKIAIISPKLQEQIERNKPYLIKWASKESENDNVSIILMHNGQQILTITDETKNSGIFKWNVDKNLEISSEYQIKVLWKSPSSSPDNHDVSQKFTITDVVDQTEAPDTTIISKSVGINYNDRSNSILIVLRDGSFGEFFIDEESMVGFMPSDTNEISVIEGGVFSAPSVNNISKIRLFVGSAPNLNDKWDSRIIETESNSIYYGGGNNLKPGTTYYVNIQFYDSKHGWSKVQTKKWKMIL